MFNLNQVVEAFEGITVTLGKDTVMLEGMTYVELYEFICTLSDTEAAELVRQLEDKLGQDVTAEIMTAVIVIADGVEELMEDEDKEVNEPEEGIELPKEKAPLSPVEMVDMNDFYSFSPDLITEGLDDNSLEFAYIMGLFNSGYTTSQVFTAVEERKKREHEHEMTKIKHEHELQMAKLKFEYEKEIATIQLENSKVQAEIATKQMSVKQLLG
jgi:hypothetical protein